MLRTASLFVLLGPLLVSCLSTGPDLAVGGYMTHVPTLTDDLLAGHFGPPRPEIWDKYASKKPEEPRTTRTPPGFKDLPGSEESGKESPAEALWYQWASRDFTIPNTPENREKLRLVLQVLELQITVLDDNLKNEGRNFGAGVVYTPSRLVIKDGRVMRIEKSAEPFHRERTRKELAELWQDYNLIANYLERSGLFLLDRLTVRPSSLGG